MQEKCDRSHLPGPKHCQKASKVPTEGEKEREKSKQTYINALIRAHMFTNLTHERIRHETVFTLFTLTLGLMRDAYKAVQVRKKRETEMSIPSLLTKNYTHRTKIVNITVYLNHTVKRNVLFIIVCSLAVNSCYIITVDLIASCGMFYYSKLVYQ